MSEQKQVSADIFNQDVNDNAGYRYTTKASLSSKIANLSITLATLDICDFYSKRVIDIGCGDGSFTTELFLREQLGSICGIDPANEAIKLAKLRAGDRNIVYEVQNGEQLSFASDSFDIAHLRGILHHSENPIKVLREALRVAPTVIAIEPNGYNLGLKLLEKFSPYHIEHKERSFPSFLLRRWAKQVGGEISSERYVGLVPFFCPDRLAMILKAIEPGIERTPVVNALACAVYIFVIKRVNVEAKDK